MFEQEENKTKRKNLCLHLEALSIFGIAFPNKIHTMYVFVGGQGQCLMRTSVVEHSCHLSCFYFIQSFCLGLRFCQPDEMIALITKWMWKEKKINTNANIQGHVEGGDDDMTASIFYFISSFFDYLCRLHHMSVTLSVRVCFFSLAFSLQCYSYLWGHYNHIRNSTVTRNHMIDELWHTFFRSLAASVFFFVDGFYRNHRAFVTAHNCWWRCIYWHIYLHPTLIVLMNDGIYGGKRNARLKLSFQLHRINCCFIFVLFV